MRKERTMNQQQVKSAVSSTDKSDKVKRQLVAYIETCRVIGQMIKAKGTVPSGVLYADVMGNLSLPNYQAIIVALEVAGVVKSENHVLTWIGK